MRVCFVVFMAYMYVMRYSLLYLIPSLDSEQTRKALLELLTDIALNTMRFQSVLIYLDIDSGNTTTNKHPFVFSDNALRHRWMSVEHILLSLYALDRVNCTYLNDVLSRARHINDHGLTAQLVMGAWRGVMGRYIDLSKYQGANSKLQGEIAKWLHDDPTGKHCPVEVCRIPDTTPPSDPTCEFIKDQLVRIGKAAITNKQ